MYMRYAQGFLLVFSITSTSSLAELTELREQIVHMKNNDPTIPIVLVGNKADLEDDRRVTRAKAFQVSQMWGNIPYYETSARRKLNVNEVFVDVCRQIIRKDMSLRKQDQQGGGGRRGKKRGRRRHDDERHNDRDRGSRCVIL
jgi:Ras-related protein Rap-1B